MFLLPRGRVKYTTVGPSCIRSAPVRPVFLFVSIPVSSSFPFFFCAVRLMVDPACRAVDRKASAKHTASFAAMLLAERKSATSATKNNRKSCVVDRNGISGNSAFSQLALTRWEGIEGRRATYTCTSSTTASGSSTAPATATAGPSSSPPALPQR